MQRHKVGRGQANCMTDNSRTKHNRLQTAQSHQFIRSYLNQLIVSLRTRNDRFFHCEGCPDRRGPRYGMTSKGSEDDDGSGASRNSASSLAHNRSASKSWISTCGRAAGEEAVDSVTARISKGAVKLSKQTCTSRSVRSDEGYPYATSSPVVTSRQVTNA